MLGNPFKNKKTTESESRSIFAVISLLIVLGFLPACWKALIVGGSVHRHYLMDGVYEGSDSCGPNKVVVRVFIEENRIAKIDVLQNWGMRARRTMPTIPDRIIEEQSTNVDAVTGATNSSRVIMNAVHKAVLKAVRKIACFSPGGGFLLKMTGSGVLKDETGLQDTIRCLDSQVPEVPGFRDVPCFTLILYGIRPVESEFLRIAP